MKIKDKIKILEKTTGRIYDKEVELSEKVEHLEWQRLKLSRARERQERRLEEYRMIDELLESLPKTRRVDKLQ